MADYQFHLLNMLPSNPFFYMLFSFKKYQINQRSILTEKLIMDRQTELVVIVAPAHKWQEEFSPAVIHPM